LFLAHFLLNKKNSKGVLDEKLSNSQWAGRMRTKSGQKGFTLVEVVMVVRLPFPLFYPGFRIFG